MDWIWCELGRRQLEWGGRRRGGRRGQVAGRRDATSLNSPARQEGLGESNKTEKKKRT